MNVKIELRINATADDNAFDKVTTAILLMKEARKVMEASGCTTRHVEVDEDGVSMTGWRTVPRVQDTSAI